MDAKGKQHQSAIVTGASSGLGLGITQALLERGYHVVANVCSYVLFGLGVSGTLGVKAPLPLKSPDIYKPLFWGGLWGMLFGLFIKTAWNRLYLVGFLYVLAPLLALFLFFLPMSGAGYFGLNRGPMFTLYLVLVNLPFGIVTALAAKAIIGKEP